MCVTCFENETKIEIKRRVRKKKERERVRRKNEKTSARTAEQTNTKNSFVDPGHTGQFIPGLTKE
jgi:hypothetical protein